MLTEAELTCVRTLIVEKEAAERDYSEHKFGATERLLLANMGLAGWSRQLLQHIHELEKKLHPYPPMTWMPRGDNYE